MSLCDFGELCPTCFLVIFECSSVSLEFCFVIITHTTDHTIHMVVRNNFFMVSNGHAPTKQTHSHGCRLGETNS